MDSPALTRIEGCSMQNSQIAHVHVFVSDRPGGVRAGFVQGPGKLTFEIEQPLEKSF